MTGCERDSVYLGVHTDCNFSRCGTLCVCVCERERNVCLWKLHVVTVSVCVYMCVRERYCNAVRHFRNAKSENPNVRTSIAYCEGVVCTEVACSLRML